MLVFYGAADPRFCVLLRPSRSANQAAALRLGRTEEPRRRKAIVAAAVTVDLGVLGP